MGVLLDEITSCGGGGCAHGCGECDHDGPGVLPAQLPIPGRFVAVAQGPSREQVLTAGHRGAGGVAAPVYVCAAAPVIVRNGIPAVVGVAGSLPWGLFVL